MNLKTHLMTLVKEMCVTFESQLTRSNTKFVKETISYGDKLEGKIEWKLFEW